MKFVLVAAVLLLLITSANAQIVPLTKWYWQIDGAVKIDKPAKIYDIDMEENTAAFILSLKNSGHTVICYFAAGDWESWRSDAASFPNSVKGRNVSGWAGEKWVDIRSPIVRDIMAKRMDRAREKGCDGLEPDLVDGFVNNTGFPLTKNDQINYNKFLASYSHSLGMLIALKNTPELVSDLVSSFDFSVAEECFKYNECASYSPFIQQGKAVLSAEYSTYSINKCTKAKNLQFSLAFFNLALNGRKYQPCP